MDADFYSRFYRATENSRIHSRFCAQVYGVDLCQHGFADAGQLNLLVRAGRIGSSSRALDVGCGNGLITEYLSDHTGGCFTGMDNEAEAIRIALARTAAKRGRLAFIQADLNCLPTGGPKYSAILLIDTIYFSTNLDQTIRDLRDLMGPDGCMLFLYSIGPALLGTEDFDKSVLNADRTPLSEALHRAQLSVQSTDLTDEDYRLAQLRRDFLQAHQEEFEAEGLGFIWQNRMGDSTDFIRAIDERKHRRYLYKASPERQEETGAG